MNIAEIIVAIGGLAGLLVATPPIMKEFRAIRSGRAIAEKQRNRYNIGRAADLEDDLEDEREFRFMFQEQCAKLRSILIQMGYPENKLPEWPKRPERQTTNG